MVDKIQYLSSSVCTMGRETSEPYQRGTVPAFERDKKERRIYLALGQAASDMFNQTSMIVFLRHFPNIYMRFFVKFNSKASFSLYHMQ